MNKRSRRLEFDGSERPALAFALFDLAMTKLMQFDDSGSCAGR
jgi:hypothetical protein